MAKRRSHAVRRAPARRHVSRPKARSHSTGMVPFVGAPPRVVTRTISKVSPKVHKALGSAKARATALAKKVNSEPTRTGVGAIAGVVAGKITSEIVKKVGAKSPTIGANKAATHLALSLVGAGAAVAGAVMKHPTVMHGATSFATWELSKADTYHDIDKGTAGVDDDSFNSAGPSDRRAKRRQLIRNFASKLRAENPDAAATQGSDSLEEHVGDLLDDYAASVQGMDDYLCNGSEETGILPLAALALPELIKAMPALKAMARGGAEAYSKQKAIESKAGTSGTSALDAFLTLEGVNPDLMDTGAKWWQFKKKRAEKKAKRKQGRKSVATNRRAPAQVSPSYDEPAMVQPMDEAPAMVQPAMVTPAASDPFAAYNSDLDSILSDQPLIVTPTDDQVMGIRNGTLPAWNLVRMN